MGWTKRSALEHGPGGTNEFSELLVVDDVGGTFLNVELVLPAVGKVTCEVDPVRATGHFMSR